MWIAKEHHLLQQLVDDRRFSLADLALVVLSGLIGILNPDSAFWFLPIALLPWIFRLVARRSPFQRTPFDLPIGVFLITAGIGFFIGYDRVAAYEKFYFIVVAVLLYYALSGQPEKNFGIISAILFWVGVGISVYFFLTHDFIGSATGIESINRIGSIWLEIRPKLKWTPIPTGYVAGLLVTTTSFMMHRLTNSDNVGWHRFLRFSVLLGFGMVLCTILATASLSVWVALLGAVGIWPIWKLLSQKTVYASRRDVFPRLMLIYLMFVAVILSATSTAASSSLNYFGNNSRLEVLSRSAYFVLDFPITGAGLASFPGLYSQYMLGIPWFYFANSYNVFLDVAIEQGIGGFIVFLIIYLASIVRVSRRIQTHSSNVQTWLILFILIFVAGHGMVQDYLYNGAGTILLFYPAGMAVMFAHDPPQDQFRRQPISSVFTSRQRLIRILLGVFLLVGFLSSLNNLKSVWYSNLGAVQLAQAELTGFPKTGWHGLNIVPTLQKADTSLQTSLQFDSGNLTANYRLGIIYMYRRDFVTASKYLVAAHTSAPNHRGIKKSLGYSYLWMGDIHRALDLLAEIPETSEELDAYYWWWDNQGRDDLSKNAYALMQELHTTRLQP